jgi:hypothetical protein
VAKRLQPNTSVLIGPKWKPGIVVFTDAEGVHVMSEDGDYSTLSPAKIAIRGDELDLDEGDEVLLDVGGGWERGKVLGTRPNMVRVIARSGEHWASLDSVAVLAGKDEPSAKREGDEGAGQESELSFGIRMQRFGWRYGGLVVLAFGALAPLFALVEGGGGWPVGVAWLAMHAILAAYVHAQNRPLPRFHPAGFGEPSDPGVFGKGKTVEHPPMRSKWELALFLVAGWLVVGFGPLMPGFSPWIPPIYVAALGLGTALLAYFFDRDSATEVRRLLAAKPIRDGADTGEGSLAGTAAGAAEDQPLMWREVLLYVWSTTRQVTKNITDSEGRTQTVQVNETSHYSCGLQRARQRAELRLETSLGAVDFPLRGSLWAAERGLSFGPAAVESEAWKPSRDHYGGAVADHTQAAALEQIHPGDKVLMVGELRRSSSGGSTIAGGKEGPALLFSAGERDPQAALSRDMLRRRVSIAAMILLATAPTLALALN